jgi:predicted ArsR family transcriptional regulator
MSPIIQTEADRLISLVDTKGKITAKEASKILGIKERQIEEWADFLEKHGILNLKLNFFNLKLISKKYKDDLVAKK